MGQGHHHHQFQDYNRVFATAICLNAMFVLLELGFGIYSSSLALIADAGHNFIDIMGLLLAWGSSLLASQASTERHTYGYGKSTILAALISAILLLAVTGGISWEALLRLFHPRQVAGTTVMVVAFIGVVINSATAALFIRDKKHDLNIQGAFLHMAADAAVSMGVVLAGLLIKFFGWLWIDPFVSLVIAGFIFWSTWDLFKESLNYIIDAVPARIDVSKIREYLLALEGVRQIHDLHIWPLSTTQVALTVHLIIEGDQIDNALLCRIQRDLHKRFGIDHATIQVESALTQNVCLLNDIKSEGTETV